MEENGAAIVCPGDTLKLIMSQQNISLEELASKTGVKNEYVEAICEGVSPIRKFYADNLEKVLGVDAQFWLTLQSLYENELKIYGQLNSNEEIKAAKE